MTLRPVSPAAQSLESARNAAGELPDRVGDLRDAWADPAQRDRWLEAYERRQLSFLPGLLPDQAIAWPVERTLEVLRRRYGGAVDSALAEPRTAADGDHRFDPRLASPVADRPDGGWLRRANVVGINVRTVGSFWNVVGYALTLPACHDAIHLLPIWEPGVVKSLYGPCSWELNAEFASAALAAVVPHLDRADRQLRAVVHLLHLMGRAVGMDVIPHTDRFSQIVLSHPSHFEWLRRDDDRIVDHRERLHEEVEERIVEFVADQGAATPGEPSVVDRPSLFGPDVPEQRRQRILFGEPADAAGREARRVALLRYLVARGYEPVPATMAPPYRGLEVDPDPAAATVDGFGLRWQDYRIARPEPMSRVFGPLTRYKLYRRHDDNAAWAIDFDRPRTAVWAYVCQHYAAVQRRYGFDFMRGDMSHVQMRPDGVPVQPDEHYDLLCAVKRHIVGRGVRYFAYFAETFLAPRGTMAYGDELDHLECCEAEVTLGDLQSMSVGSDRFCRELRRYLDLRRSRRCAPCFTVMTADKDDPRFDGFYLAGNEVRLFVGLFLADMPSYVALGFELRDPHPTPAPPEHYSKLYVFQQESGPNATEGPYRFGTNGALFAELSRLRLLADAIVPTIRDRPTRWLLPPDPSTGERVLCWTQQGPAPRYAFVANADTASPAMGRSVPRLEDRGPEPQLRLLYSTAGPRLEPLDRFPHFNGYHHRLGILVPGECRIYRVDGTG